jgi:membrane-bound lytic murein transglycosylase A
VWQEFKKASLICCIWLSACQQQPTEPVIEPVESVEITIPTGLALFHAHWDAVPGWGGSDMRAAMAAFQRSCAWLDNRDDDTFLNPRAEWAGRVGDWRAACTAVSMTGDTDAAILATLEAVFVPVRAMAVAPEDGTSEQTGMLTGYYEPFVEVRSQPSGEFSQPLRRRPDDLINVDLGLFDADLAGHRVVGRVENGQLTRYRDRATIEVDGLGEAFAWGRAIDVFFLQIQGSGRLIFEDGRQARAAFAAHNGLPYRSIGRELIRRGELELHAASKAGIESWLNENGSEATQELFAVNPRYVFFETQSLDQPDLGPRGSSGVALTPMASIAIDTAYHAHGVPIWLSANLPEAENWSGLVIAQDSGGAINGPLRGDFFWGWGDRAERRAGTTRAQAQWVLLLPTAVAARIVDPTPPA